MFGLRLKELRKARGITQEQLAAVIGVERSSIGKYEGKSKIVPSDDVKDRIASYFNVSVDYLLGRTNNPSPSISASSDTSLPHPDLIPIKRVRIPLLGDVAAGEPILATESYDTYIEVDDDLRCDYALRVTGDSMEPTIHIGDLVFVQQQDDVDDGQIAVVLLDDSATLKHVFHQPTGLLLISDNSVKYPPRYISFSEFDTIRVLGRAVAFRRMIK